MSRSLRRAAAVLLVAAVAAPAAAGLDAMLARGDLAKIYEKWVGSPLPDLPSF
jgi:ABC-type amino acid transport substrate-binding protein